MSSKVLLSGADISQAVQTLAAAILKKHPELEDVVLVGILSAGYPVAQRLKHALEEKKGIVVPVGKLDVGLYRDDLLSRGQYVTLRETDISFNLTGKNLILVDDILFSGRTIRAALNALLDFGRSAQIELAVLLDRGHREVPIFAHYVGKTIQTAKTDHVELRLYEIEGEDDCYLHTSNQCNISA